MQNAAATLHALWCAAGVLGSMLLYGILQERIMTQPFGGERFTHTLLLVLCNRLTTCAVAASILLVTRQDTRPKAPLSAYAAVSLSNVAATTCQHESLKHISFPLQTLAKCGKMIPVMLWGVVILRCSYTPQEYVTAVGIMVGCALFPVTGSVASKAAGNSTYTSVAGLGLVAGYLVCDGFASTWQDSLFKGTRMSIYNQSLYVSLVSSALSLAGLISSGQLQPALSFVSHHPEALRLMLALSLAATLGQFSITHTIRSYGALFATAVLTTRQLMSMLLSCILYRHPLTAGQWVGTAFVFSTVYLKAFSKQPPRSRAAAVTSVAVSERSDPEEAARHGEA